MESIIPILAAGISALVWLWIIRRYDKLEPEPLKTLLYAGLFGGLISIIPAALLNYGASSMLGVDLAIEDNHILSSLAFLVFVGFNEEIWKATATVLLIRNHRDFNEPIDGMVYAMTVCLGFAAFENLEYMFDYGLGVIVGRSLLAVPAHLAFGAIWGYGFALAKFIIPGHHYARTLAPFIVTAALFHAAYNFILTNTGSTSITFLLVLILMFFLLRQTLRRLKYLLTQSPFRNMEECPACQQINKRGSNFCTRCGEDLRSDFYQVCPACKTRYIKSGAFCPQCGLKSGEVPGPILNNASGNGSRPSQEE